MSEHHHHHHVRGKNLFITVVLNLFITIAQIIGSILSGSMALLSDALHNFSDVLALLIAYFAHKLSHKEADLTKTFGYKRAEIMAAFFNTLVLMLIAFYLIYEATAKLLHPQSVDSLTIVWLGVLSIVLNALSVMLVKNDAHHNMNMKAAYLHLLTDMITSVGVVVGGLVIYYFNFIWIDPLLSILIAFYLIIVSWGLLRSSISVLMQFAPLHIEIPKIIETVKNLEPLVEDLHHIHLWQLDDHHIHLEAHIGFKENITLQESNMILDQLERVLKENFGITHTTFQSEYERCKAKNSLCLLV